MPTRLTNDEFIRRCKAKHGTKFGYQNTFYTSAKDKVNISCETHGDFWILPSAHLRENGAGGCPSCTKNKKKSTADFISDAVSVHGNLYDYSEAVYLSAKGKLKVICREHGPFLQEASSHLSGVGCPLCWKGRKKSKTEASRASRGERFVEKSNEIHGQLYDYSLVRYQSYNLPVQIICKSHGAFFQRPGVHLRGGGCPNCAMKVRSAKGRTTQDDFVQKALEVHDGFFDYSSVAYETTHKPVIIICPEHGPFEQRPSNHLQGEGCPACADLYRGQQKKAARAENLIEDFQRVHGDRYDYSKVNYTDSRTKVEIICPAHGSFKVTPANHLQGIKCKECALENRPDYIDARVMNDPSYAARKGFLYLLRVAHPQRSLPFFKVGITSRESPEARFRYTRYSSFQIEVHDSVAGTMRLLWNKEKKIKNLIGSLEAAVAPFCNDYWHWTESFEDKNGVLRQVLEIMHG
jgi:hypothetical protein